MSLVSILQSKSQNDTQIFKSLKLVPFFVKTSQICSFYWVKVDAVRGSATCQFLDFLNFLFFFIFLKKIKK